MIMDYNVQFSDGVSAIAIPSNTAATQTEYASDVLDLQTAGYNIGAGTPIWAIFSIGTTFSGTTSNPVFVTLYGGTASGTVATQIFRSRTFSIGEMSKGVYLMAQPLPAGYAMLRFVKVAAVLSGVSLTAGAFDAYLSLNAPRF